VFAIMALYFIVFGRFLGGTLFQRLLARGERHHRLHTTSWPGIAVRRTAFFQNAYGPAISLRRASAVLSGMRGSSPRMTSQPYRSFAFALAFSASTSRSRAG
jgi:hypothetical protein